MTTLILLTFGVVAVGLLMVAFGAETRPGFDEAFDSRRDAFEHRRQIPGVS